MDAAQELHLVIDELRGMATLGQVFAATVYERERAEQAQRLADRLARVAGTAPLPTRPSPGFDDLVGRVSPAIGVEVVVLDESGAALLCRRRDDDSWCLPGGIAEIGESVTQAALRELWEEAGLRGTVSRLLGIFDGRDWGSRATVHLIHLVFLVESSGQPEPGVEMTDARYFAADALPDALHAGHDRRVPYCLELARSGGTHHDPATTVGTSLSMAQRPA